MKDSIKSSGNVFADLGLADADELLLRAELGHSVRVLIEARDYARQQDIAQLLSIKQPEVSNLMNGKYHLFSETRLLSFLNKLDQKVVFHVTPRQVGERALAVQMGV